MSDLRGIDGSELLRVWTGLVICWFLERETMEPECWIPAGGGCREREEREQGCVWVLLFLFLFYLILLMSLSWSRRIFFEDYVINAEIQRFWHDILFIVEWWSCISKLAKIFGPEFIKFDSIQNRNTYPVLQKFGINYNINFLHKFKLYYYYYKKFKNSNNYVILIRLMKFYILRNWYNCNN